MTYFWMIVFVFVFAFVQMQHYDLLIVGAGLSGIGAAVHVQKLSPSTTYQILEARERSGGTWDLFQYPGIRSDSDMYTLGYDFEPWLDRKALADGPSILKYIRKVSNDYGVEKNIRYQHRVVEARFSSNDSRWTVTVERGVENKKELITLSCQFLYVCGGYYDFEQGYQPVFPGRESFKGRFVHPQHWPKDLEYKGKQVVVIGSGATAVTIVPAMADETAHITMLQRTPTYIISTPGEDALANWLNRCLPLWLAYTLNRWKKILLGMLFFYLMTWFPNLGRWLVRKGSKNANQVSVDQLGFDFYSTASTTGVVAQLPKEYADIDKNFSPPYNPWEQRMCLVPDGDMFKALSSGKASIVTDEIQALTPSGVRTKSGRELAADIIISATGLNIKLFGGLSFYVDDEKIDISKKIVYNGMFVTDIPNMAYAVGYTNASWTLKVDLSSSYLCRLMNHMRASGYKQFTARCDDPSIERLPMLNLTSNYIKRAEPTLPKQGSRRPFRYWHNYFMDLLSLRYSNLDTDTVLEFK